MFTRVSTFSNHSITLDALQKRQASMADLNADMSSGVKYSSFSEVAQAGETRRVVDFTSTVDSIKTYLRNNEVMRSRLEVMDKSVAQLEDLTTEALRAMATERSAVRSDHPLTAQMKALLQQVEDRLNVSTAGRYLFSGSDTTQRAVDSLQISNLDSSNGETDNYYTGNGTDISQRISDDVTVQYNVRANNPAFQKLIASMHLAIKGEANNSDSMLADAVDMANEARKELSGIRNTIANNLATVEKINKQHDSFNTYFKNTLGEVVGTNVAEASIQLSLDQAVLTASFQAFGRISNLTLGQYLR